MNNRVHQGHLARKRFGQNFLNDQFVIDSIVSAINPQKGQAMVEIGPGLAALTEPVGERLDQLTVIELDRDLAARLQTHPFLGPKLTIYQQDVMREQVQKLAFELQVRGLMNVQFAVKDNEVYLIEVNPRAARTVPFVSKATGVPLAKVAARVMAGKTLAQQGVTKEIIPPYYSVKEVVLPFNKFPGVDPLLGPEMRSTGEVMGVGRTFAEAFAKAQLGSNSTMKKQGRALLSVREGDKERVVDLAAKLLKFGFELDATHGTAIVLGEAGINPRLVNKVHEGRPHIQDRIKNGEYTYIINTTAGRQAIEDSKLIRRSALQYKVHYDTTLNGGFATAMALNADATEKVISVQEMHAQITK